MTLQIHQPQTPKQQTIGERIYVMRKYRLMKQEELATAIGVSRPYLSMIESGARQPRLDLLNKIAKILNCELVCTLTLRE